MKTDNNKSRYYEEMKDCLLRMKPDEMVITFRRVDKHNRRRLHGCTLQMPDAVAAPTFYLEDLYEAYCNGTSAEDLAESLIRYSKENNLMDLPGNIDVDDYECVRKNLGLMVIGNDRNIDYLKDLVHETIEDLALIPIIFTNDSHGTGCIKIREEFLSMWNVTKEELLREAMDNAPRLMPLTFKQLSDIIGEEPEDRQEELFVISNCYFAGGASAIFYPGVLSCIGTALNRDLFILPSSINEVILVSDVGQDPQKLKRIVEEVNRTQVSLQEVLTDSVYHYERKKDRFRRILPA